MSGPTGLLRRSPLRQSRRAQDHAKLDDRASEPANLRDPQVASWPIKLELRAEFRGTRCHLAWRAAEKGPLFRLRSLVAFMHDNLDVVVCNLAIFFDLDRRDPDHYGPELDMIRVDTLDPNQVGVLR